MIFALLVWSELVGIFIILFVLALGAAAVVVLLFVRSSQKKNAPPPQTPPPPRQISHRPIQIGSEVLRFLRRHLIHLLLFLPGAFILVTVHESAHAIVALARGGIIQEIHLWPTRQNWGGSVSYKLPEAQATRWDVALGSAQQ